MESPNIRILLVEDSPGDTRLLEEEMTDAGLTAFHVVHAGRLATAVRSYAPGAFDVVLLDLSLPDSKGLDTVKRAVAAMPDVPIVVLTTLDDEVLAVQAIQAGAQDFLVKGQCEGYFLVRALRAAMARHVTGTQSDREMRTLERFVRRQLIGPAAELFGSAPLRESLPDTFDEMIQRYGDLVEGAAAERARGSEPEVSEALVAMAERLGVLRAGPRDVVEIHGSALKSRSMGATQRTIETQAEEARLMVLELMGYLAGFYRRYSLTGGAPEASGDRSAGEGAAAGRR